MEHTSKTFDRLWNYGNPDETETAFRELLPVAEQDPEFHTQLLTQIARTQGLQRRFDDAHETLDRALELIDLHEGAGEISGLPRVRYLLERGRVLNSSGNPAESRPFFEEAWELGKKAEEHVHAVDAAHMLAIVGENPTEELRWNREAMEYAEERGDERARGWLGALYNNIGYTYLTMEEYGKSLEAYQKGLDWQLERNRPATPVRIAKWCVARAMRGLGRTEEALERQRALKAEYEEDGGEGGYVYEEIGECLLELGRDEHDPEVVECFANAHRILSQDAWFVADFPERLARLARLGGVEEKESAG